MIKLIRATGMNGSYAKFEIEGGSNNDSIGDQVWISNCGKQMEVCESVRGEILKEVSRLFEHPKAFLGAFRRMTE